MVGNFSSRELPGYKLARRFGAFGPRDNRPPLDTRTGTRINPVKGISIEIFGFSGRSRRVPKEPMNSQIQRIRSIASVLPDFPILPYVTIQSFPTLARASRLPLRSALTLLSQCRRYFFG